MSKIFFTGDSHFNQERTLKMSKRPFKNVEEMNKVMISNWNNIVGKDDVVYHLGDFGDYRTREVLNGKIILIKGNYERSGYKDEFKKYLDYFDEIYEFTHSINIGDYHINMTHEPSRLKDTPIDKTNINLFAHVHKLCMIKSYGINVGMDCHHFTPIDFDTVLFYHGGILNYYDNNVFY